MEYRMNRRTGDRISVIGLGASSIGAAGETDGIATLELAFENGVNYYDLAAGEAACFPLYGKAFSSVRDKVLYQIHFGADYTSGKYGWTTALDNVKKAVAWQLEQLNTDYIDYGFIHCLDEASDWDAYLKNGVLDYIQALKAQGVVRHIGMSSHTPALAQTALDTGLVDMLMFSINPGYDYHHGDYAKGSSDEREALYLRCEKDGVGISVMKAFSGGQLLDEKSSPFGKALTKSQCIQYALDKPGVLTVLPGIRNKQDMEDILSFLKASEEEKDYSVLGSFTPADTEGKCVYCHHCQPCPVGLDIGLINKYYEQHSKKSVASLCSCSSSLEPPCWLLSSVTSSLRAALSSAPAPPSLRWATLKLTFRNSSAALRRPPLRPRTQVSAPMPRCSIR